MTEIKELPDFIPEDLQTEPNQSQEKTEEKRQYRGFQDMDKDEHRRISAEGLARLNGLKSMQRDAQRILAAHPIMEAKELMDALMGKGHNCTNSEAVLMVQTYKAIVKGDTKAAEFVRDTSGQKPTEKIDINAEVQMQRFDKKVIEILDDDIVDVDFEVIDDDDWQL